VDLVAVALPDRQHGVFPSRDLPMLYPVVTGHVARVDARVVGGLDATGAGVAAFQDAVTVRPGDQVATPRPDAAVSIPEPRLTTPQELVRQLEVEVVPDALRNAAPQTVTTTFTL
jgi:hypothetical protein